MGVNWGGMGGPNPVIHRGCLCPPGYKVSSSITLLETEQSVNRLLLYHLSTGPGWSMPAPSKAEARHQRFRALGGLLTAFRKGMLANGINQLLFLKASFCLQTEQKEDPSETSGAFTNTAPAPAWSNTEEPPQSDIAFICLRTGR
ncbi:unnamed protein product [Tetraodon nigroviridis]|uniref:(spotted green pufferfish) hypothetical protein n=1 Tax=Tetraodon nigroviridis TaxID=99883 RepID=Q4RJM6_TETNG|nr:unnamed protein product [Tetraodon nigroviridis]